MSNQAWQVTPEQNRRWMLENKWRSDVLCYAELVTAMALAEQDSELKAKLRQDFTIATHDLYTRIAELELAAEKAK